jgi:hypothetical protein
MLRAINARTEIRRRDKRDNCNGATLLPTFSDSNPALLTLHSSWNIVRLTSTADYLAGSNAHDTVRPFLLLT